MSDRVGNPEDRFSRVAALTSISDFMLLYRACQTKKSGFLNLNVQSVMISTPISAVIVWIVFHS